MLVPRRNELNQALRLVYTVQCTHQKHKDTSSSGSDREAVSVLRNRKRQLFIAVLCKTDVDDRWVPTCDYVYTISVRWG